MSSLDGRHLRSVARGQPGTAPADRQQVGSPTRGRGQAGEEYAVSSRPQPSASRSALETSVNNQPCHSILRALSHKELCGALLARPWGELVRTGWDALSPGANGMDLP